MRPCPTCGLMTPEIMYKQRLEDDSHLFMMESEIRRLKAELAEAKESVAEAQQCYEFVDRQNNELRDKLAEARKVPEGWKLVPVEPTDAMCSAGEDVAIIALGGDRPLLVNEGQIYCAMIDAAPEYKP